MNSATARLFDLTGQVAIVTGAGAGIGASIASHLAGAGASVVVADIDKDAADRTVETIQADGGTAASFRADATSIPDGDSQAFVRALRAKKQHGQIINLASTGGYKPNIDFVAYDASKGGVVMLTRSLALNLAQFDFRVNGIAPGLIQTPGVGAMDDHSTANVNQITDRVPLKRLGEADDIGKVALFLASDAASYMTGSIVTVDGGLLIS
jgi:NAD(P)-dependent dehydrogenase (short-subunit alcohol dehydrogenase family)